MDTNVFKRAYFYALTRFSIRSLISLPVIMMFFVVFPSHAHAATITSSATGNWNTAGTWTPAQVPTSADDVVIVSGHTVTYNVGTATTTINSLWVKNGGTLTHTDNSTTKSFIINLSMASTTIESGATVTSNALGFDSGYGTGVGGSFAGGGYGGNGGNYLSNAGGTTYGSAVSPVDLGSGGGTNCGGGSGGGAILITVSGTVTVNGAISSNGGSLQGGGGSGGTVYINTATLAGSGSMTANGGNGVGGGGCVGGGGGGGRVALLYTTSTYSGTLTVSGGSAVEATDGSVGSIVKLVGGSTGALTVDSGSFSLSGTYSSLTLSSSNTTVTVASATTLTITGSGTSLAGSSGSTLTINGTVTASSMASTSIPTINLNGGGTLTPSSNFTVLSGSNLVWAGTLSNTNLFIVGTTTMATTTQLSLTGNITILSGGALTHSDNSTVRSYVINLSLTGNLTVDSGGTINTNALGFDAGYGTGVGGNFSGGGYGGNGGNYLSNAGGTTYGSAVSPVDLGSGGGNNSGSGGSGGGVILITVSGTATVNGAISSNGGAPLGGGGSGGTVYINASTLAGSGSMTANGGNGVNGGGFVGGGGGGGRVALLYTTSTYSGTLTVSGGAGSQATDGSAGTIYPTFFYWRGTTNSTWTTATNWLGGVAPSTTSDIAVVNGSITTSPIINSTIGLAGISVGTTSSSTLILGSSANITVGSTYAFLIGATGILFQNNNATTSITGNVTVNSGGNITHSANTTARTSLVNLSITGNFTLDSGSTINTNSLGFIFNNGPGTTAACSTLYGSAGSYGGIGGLVGGACGTGAIAGATYGSATNPIDIGSGGGGTQGRSGGGAVIIVVTGTLTNNGSVTANGATTGGGQEAGGGSGGTVSFTAGTLTGSGTITANGGTGGAGGNGSGGGGGRVLLSYSLSNSYTGTPVATAGTGNSNNGTDGTVVVYASTTNDITFTSGIYTPTSNVSYRHITITSTSIYVPSGVTLTATGTFTANSTTVLGVTGTATFSNTTIASSFTLGGAGTFSGGTALIQNGGTLTATSTTQRTFENMTIQSGGNLTHSSNSTAKTHIINFSVTSNFTVDSGGTIDVKGLGFTFNNGPGTAPAYCSGVYGGGGSYGGIGGLTGGACGVGSIVGVTYGSTTTPTDLGSGGGGTQGRSGGGAVIIVVTGTLTNNGSVTANGATTGGGQEAGGGSGGTVSFTAGTLTGSGTITANGGTGGAGGNGSGGGGGRIALLYFRYTYSGTYTVTKGTGNNSNGTNGTTYRFKQNIRIKATASQNTKKTTNLVGIWSFNGVDMSSTVAYDRSGNGNNGALTNTSVISPGKVGQALQFNGINDKITISGISLTSNFTVSLWIFPTPSSDTYGALITSSGANPGLYYKQDTRKISYYTGLDNLNNSALPDNTWSNVIVVRSSGTITFYLNGASNGTLSNASTFAPVTLGDDGSSQTFKGKMDEVRIYNTAFTGAQVTGLYKLGAGSKVSASQNAKKTTGLVGLWSFNGPDISGTTAYDRSGNGNNGTLTNGPTVIAGKIGQALQFDGSNDYVNISDAGFPLGSANRTMTAWIKWDGTTSGVLEGRRLILGYGSNVSTQGYSYRVGQAGAGVVDFVGFNAGDSTALFTLVANTWTHLTNTYDGTNVRTYVNGSLVATQTLALNTVSSTGFRIGWGYDTSSAYFSGPIDDVRIYNIALSATQVLQLYKLGKVTIKGSVVQ